MQEPRKLVLVTGNIAHARKITLGLAARDIEVQPLVYEGRYDSNILLEKLKSFYQNDERSIDALDRLTIFHSYQMDLLDQYWQEKSSRLLLDLNIENICFSKPLRDHLVPRYLRSSGIEIEQYYVYSTFPEFQREAVDRWPYNTILADVGSPELLFFDTSHKFQHEFGKKPYVKR